MVLLITPFASGTLLDPKTHLVFSVSFRSNKNWSTKNKKEVRHYANEQQLSEADERASNSWLNFSFGIERFGIERATLPRSSWLKVVLSRLMHRWTWEPPQLVASRQCRRQPSPPLLRH